MKSWLPRWLIASGLIEILCGCALIGWCLFQAIPEGRAPQTALWRALPYVIAALELGGMLSVIVGAIRSVRARAPESPARDR